MSRLVSKCFVLITLVLATAFRDVAAEITRISFPLPTDLESDRDTLLIQNLLIFQAFSEVDREKKGSCKFTSSDEGELVIEGEREAVRSFAGALGKVIEQEMDEKAFQSCKENYLASSGNLLENALTEEIERRDLLEVRKSLRPLVEALCASASVAGENLASTVAIDLSRSDHFYSLPMSRTDQDHIYELIESMGGSGYWSLLKQKKRMEKLGDKVDDVHPLRFIAYIYGHPHLKGNMDKIMGDRFKRRGFLNGHGKKEGFAQRMMKEMRRNNLIRYLPGFARSVRVDENEISPFFHRHDWEGLLRYLNKKC
ncbi:MAG: hypothetical protein AAGE99_03290 [Chlamydiota bacterium]